MRLTPKKLAEVLGRFSLPILLFVAPFDLYGRVCKCAFCTPFHRIGFHQPQDVPTRMIAVQRPESFFASSPRPHQRRHVLRTQTFRPRPRIRPRPAALPEQTNTRCPAPPGFAPRAVLQVLKLLRPKLARPRPAWALPAPQTPDAKHEATDPHEDEENENDAEAEVEALLAFAEGLDMGGSEDDMEVVTHPPPSPLPATPSASPLPPATPPPRAPQRLCPAAGRLYQNPFSEYVARRSDASVPHSPTALQALASVSPPPQPSPAAAPPAGLYTGPIHSARSATALMERRSLAITAAADYGQKEEGNKEPPSPTRRQGRGWNRGASAEQKPKDEAVAAGRTAEGKNGGGGGGRPLEMPRVVLVDEEWGLRRQRRLAQLPYWENPAL